MLSLAGSVSGVIVTGEVGQGRLALRAPGGASSTCLRAHARAAHHVTRCVLLQLHDEEPVWLVP